MGSNDPADSAHLAVNIVPGIGEGHWPEPELGLAVEAVHVDMDELARRRETFAFETTLASRAFAPWLRARSAEGYEVFLVSCVA